MLWLQRQSKYFSFYFDIPVVCKPLTTNLRTLTRPPNIDTSRLHSYPSGETVSAKRLVLWRIPHWGYKLWSKVCRTSKTNTCLLLSTSGVLAARFESASKCLLDQFERGEQPGNVYTFSQMKRYMTLCPWIVSQQPCHDLLHTHWFVHTATNQDSVSCVWCQLSRAHVKWISCK